MIKGVNHQVVEVNDTASEYFERIIFFVKPEYSFISEGKIRERASRIAAGATLPPPSKKPTVSKALTFLKFLTTAIFGAAVGVMLFKILF